MHPGQLRRGSWSHPMPFSSAQRVVPFISPKRCTSSWTRRYVATLVVPDVSVPELLRWLSAMTAPEMAPHVSWCPPMPAPNPSDSR